MVPNEKPSLPLPYGTGLKACIYEEGWSPQGSGYRERCITPTMGECSIRYGPDPLGTGLSDETRPLRA